MLEKLDNNSIEIREFQPEETKIILQRHEVYDKDMDSKTAGKLKPEGRENAETESKRRIEKIINQVPESERGKLFFLVLSSDTTYGEGARSIETAEIITKNIEEALKENSINRENFLNVSQIYRQTEKGKPRPTSQLREPLMFENTPEFVDFLKEKYASEDFWEAFETDMEKEKRLEMGAEGPEEIADRIEKFLRLIKRYSEFFHKSHSDSRLVVWCVSHYDTISPWTRKYILQEEVVESELGVDYGAGLVLSIEKDGRVKGNVGSEEYEVQV